MKSETKETEFSSERNLLAGEAAKRLGVGVQTLHFYEQQNLIPPPPRTRSGYRLYSPEVVERVRFIRKAQTLGFTLEEIKEILDLAREGECPCGHVQTTLGEKLSEVDSRIQELTDFRGELVSLIEKTSKTSANESGARVCSIVEEAPPLPEGLIKTRTLAPKRRRRQKSLL